MPSRVVDPMRSQTKCYQDSRLTHARSVDRLSKSHRENTSRNSLKARLNHRNRGDGNLIDSDCRILYPGLGEKERPTQVCGWRVQERSRRSLRSKAGLDTTYGVERGPSGSGKVIAKPRAVDDVSRLRNGPLCGP